MPHTAQTIRDIAERLTRLQGALLPILHAIQDHFGYLPEQTVPEVAKVLNQSQAQVHGVVSFYHHFRTKPSGKNTLYVCRSEACQAVGGKELMDFARKTLGIETEQTSSDQRVTLQAVYCLGNCACAPAVMVNKDLYGRVTSKQLQQLLDEL